MIEVVLFVLGAVFGSFLTAFTDRIHDGRDWVKARSTCDNCKHVLGVTDLIPILSWVAHRGRCAHCKKKVSFRYPLIEIITGLAFVASYVYWPTGFEGFEAARFVFWLAIVVGYVGLSTYDIRWLILPNRILYPMIAATILFVAVEAVFFDGGAEVVRGAVLGLLFCGGVFYLIFQISKGKWIGGGDVKLGFLLGMLAGGPLESVFIILLASILGLAAALPALALRKLGPKSQIPFGPVLIIAGFIMFLFGADILDWYTGDFVEL